MTNICDYSKQKSRQSALARFDRAPVVPVAKALQTPPTCRGWCKLFNGVTPDRAPAQEAVLLVRFGRR
jgi:hypothetical protein